MRITIPKDPIVLSIIFGSIAFVIVLFIFILSKPKMIMKINRKKNLDWFKLIMVSITIFIGVAICTFLVITKDQYKIAFPSY